MDRRALVLGGIGSLVVPARLVAKQRGTKRNKPKLITKNFRKLERISLSENGSNGSPYPSEINVSGFKQGRIERITVVIRGLSVQLSRVVHMLLVAPNGKSVEMFGSVGDNASPLEAIVLTLDDQAKRDLPFNTPLLSGTYRPTRYSEYPYADPAPPEPHAERFAAFKGGNPNGTWQLFVNEDNVAGSGQVSLWELKITAKVKG